MKEEQRRTIMITIITFTLISILNSCQNLYLSRKNNSGTILDNRIEEIFNGNSADKTK